MRHRLLLMLAGTLLAPATLDVAPAASAGLCLVEEGQSPYVIYCEPDAPAWIHDAAAEVRRVLHISTGVELPLSSHPARHMLCLGDNRAARRAGVSLPADVADDAFRLRTVGENVYIVGKDALRGPAGDSRGTLYGAYELLETLGVRWLLPGEWGEDVPRHSTLLVPRLDALHSPAFSVRVLQDVQERVLPDGKPPSPTSLWLKRQRLCSTFADNRLSAGHAWDDYITPEQVAEHPQWLAQDAAGRPRRFARHKAVKFCTNQPELIAAFSTGVVRSLDRNPQRLCASISASDGGDFCHCARCAPRLTRDPHGNVSFAPLIVAFYDAVARRVAAARPGRLVCGIVYYNYMYPPPPPQEKLASNLWLVWTPLYYYGWGLAKPVYRDEFRRVAAGWRALTPNLAYHNYSTWMRSYQGAPLPVGREILKLELPAAHQAGARAVNMVGLGAWGYGAPTNYILARQMWNPAVDVEALYREWLQRAYGPGWTAMQELNRLLETRFMARKTQESPIYRGQNYEVNQEMLAAVHAPLFSAMERLYRRAMAQAVTASQRRRLEMFGDNLTVLHYNLRQAGLCSDTEQSCFYRDEEAYRRFLGDTEFSLALYRDHRSRYLVPIWKGEYRGP